MHPLPSPVVELELSDHGRIQSGPIAAERDLQDGGTLCKQADCSGSSRTPLQHLAAPAWWMSVQDISWTWAPVFALFVLLRKELLLYLYSDTK